MWGDVERKKWVGYRENIEEYGKMLTYYYESTYHEIVHLTVPNKSVEDKYI